MSMSFFTVTDEGIQGASEGARLEAEDRQQPEECKARVSSLDTPMEI